MPEFKITVQPPPTVIEIAAISERSALEALVEYYPDHAPLAVQGPKDDAPRPLVGACERCGCVLTDGDESISRDAGDREITLCLSCARKSC